MSEKYLGPEFDKWTDMWAKAQVDGTFADAPKPPACGGNVGANDFFGNHRPAEKSDLKDSDTEYWRQVYNLSSHQGEAPDVLAEARKAEEKKKKSKIEEPVRPSEKKDETKAKAKKMGQDPNPQRPDTFGKDGVDKKGTTKVSPGWAAMDEDFVKLDGLKRKLYDLECKMHSKEGLSEQKYKAITSQLDSLKRQIDNLSDDLTPKYGTDHLS